MPSTLLPQVDYYLGLDAQRFLGNSVSTFTAFIMLERKWAHRWAEQQGPGLAALALRGAGHSRPR